MKLTDLGQKSVRAYLEAFVGPPARNANNNQHSQTQLVQAFAKVKGHFPKSGRQMSNIIWNGASSPHLDALLNFIHAKLREHSNRESKANFQASLPDSGWPQWLDELKLPTLALAQLREEVRPAAEYASVLADASRARQQELLEQPFVGRTNEINWLNAYLADKEGKIIVVHGPGGAGKSSLLARAAKSNNRWISRFISEAKEAFQSAAWNDLEDDLSAQLEGSTGDLRRFLQQDHRAPVTILIDGIDEAPETGVNKLWNERLGRNVTLILGVRADTPQELQSFLPINSGVNPVHYLALGDLSPEDVGNWVQQWATGKRVDNIAELGRLIHQVTEGYPLFISMLLRETNPATMAAQLGQQINDAGQVTRGQGELPAAFVQYAFDCWSRVRTESHAWLIPAMAAARGPIHRSLLNRIRGGGSEISGLDTIHESIGRWFKRSIDGTLAWTHPRLGDVFRQVQSLRDTKAEREANLRQILMEDVERDAKNPRYNSEGENQAGRYDAAHLVDHLITALEHGQDAAVDQAAIALASADFVVRWWQTVGLAVAMRQARRLRAAIRRHWPRHVPKIVNSLPAILESIGPAWEIGVRPLQAIANHSGQTELYVSARDRLDRLGEPWFHRTWPRELHESGVQLVMSGNLKCLLTDRQNRLWIGTTHGLYCAEDGGVPERRGKEVRGVTCLLLDGQNRVWVGAHNGLFCAEDGGEAQRSEEKVGWVNCLLLDGQNRVWVGAENGLFCAENNGDTKRRGEEVEEVNCLLLDGQNRVWVGARNGLFCAEKDGDAERRGEVVEEVKCLLLDYQNRVWVGANNGLFCAVSNGDAEVRERLSTAEHVIQNARDGRLLVSAGSEWGVYEWRHPDQG